MKNVTRLAVLSLVLLGVFLFVVSKPTFAACECLVPAAGVPAGGDCSPAAGGKKDMCDSSGEKIPDQAYGLWTSTPQSPGIPEEPLCPKNANPAYGPGVKSNPAEGQPCNIYTQTYFRPPFKVPTLGDLLGNVVRLFFFIAGIYALFLLLLGGFEWVSSGGEEKKLTSARQKILNAIIGLVVMVAVLTLVIVMEQVVFGGKVCLGISCPINLSGVAIVK